MDKCTSGVCHFADRPIINRFVEVEIRIDDHDYKYFANGTSFKVVLLIEYDDCDISGSPRHTQDFTFVWIETHRPSSRPFL